MNRTAQAAPRYTFRFTVVACLSLASWCTAQQTSTEGTHKPYVLANGDVQIAASHSLVSIARSWDALFSAGRAAPKLVIAEGDNYSAMSLLTFDRALAAVMGCEYTRIGLGNNLKIAADPLAIRVGHAGTTPASGVPALGVIVNPANPISSLSLTQLVRIFTIGAPGGDLAYWNQLGVSTDLASRRIAPVGPMPSDYLDSGDPQAGEFLSVDKFNGAVMNHAYQGLQQYQEVVERVREDKSAVGIVALNIPLDGVRVVALQRAEGGKAELPDEETIANGRYPLDRYVYLYLRVGKSTPVDPLALEYARTALSDEGQRALTAAGYIALNPAELAEERARLKR